MARRHLDKNSEEGLENSEEGWQADWRVGSEDSSESSERECLWEEWTRTRIFKKDLEESAEEIWEEALEEILEEGVVEMSEESTEERPRRLRSDVE